MERARAAALASQLGGYVSTHMSQGGRAFLRCRHLACACKAQRWGMRSRAPVACSRRAWGAAAPHQAQSAAEHSQLSSVYCIDHSLQAVEPAHQLILGRAQRIAPMYPCGPQP
jgi:hypothetical protein